MIPKRLWVSWLSLSYIWFREFVTRSLTSLMLPAVKTGATSEIVQKIYTGKCISMGAWRAIHAQTPPEVSTSLSSCRNTSKIQLGLTQLWFSKNGLFFGQHMEPDFKNKISSFKHNLTLKNSRITPKVHIVLSHMAEYRELSCMICLFLVCLAQSLLCSTWPPLLLPHPPPPRIFCHSTPSCASAMIGLSALESTCPSPNMENYVVSCYVCHAYQMTGLLTRLAASSTSHQSKHCCPIRFWHHTSLEPERTFVTHR